MDTNQQIKNDIGSHIVALQNEDLGPVELGTPVAVQTENTRYIIDHKTIAIPLLVEALKTQDKPIMVGYAAFCLRQLAYEKGKDIATVVYTDLLSKCKDISIEERFALNELRLYLMSK